MKAVQVDPNWRVDVVDVPEPRIQRPDDVLVRVRRASVCGSDLRITPPNSTHRPGHEFVGTVADAGPAVRRFRVGDRVIGACLVGCGACAPCGRGDPLGCARHWEVYGEEPGVPGCQCELVRVPVGDLHLALQGDLPDDVALLLTDSLPTAWLGARAAEIGPGSDVLVIGLGPVGLCAVWCARRHGARVLAVDPNPARAAFAARLGAHVLNPAEPVAEQVRDRTCGRRASVVLEAVGDQNTVVAAVESAAARGTVVLLGMVVRPSIALPLHRIGARSLTMRGLVCAPTTAWPTLLPVVSGGYEPLGEIVNHYAALADAPAVYRALRKPGGPILKAALSP